MPLLEVWSHSRTLLLTDVARTSSCRTVGTASSPATLQAAVALSLALCRARSLEKMVEGRKRVAVTMTRLLSEPVDAETSLAPARPWWS